jgi:hypothetical protein
VNDVRERHAPQQGRHEGPEEQRQIPVAPPPRPLELAAEFERDDAQDERHQNQEQRQVKPAEHRRVPMRERREDRPARRQQPHLVPIPHRSDAVDDHTTIRVVLGDERQQNPDAEIEPLEKEIPCEQHRDQNEPNRLQIHNAPLELGREQRAEG